MVFCHCYWCMIRRLEFSIMNGISKDTNMSECEKIFYLEYLCCSGKKEEEMRWKMKRMVEKGKVKGKSKGRGSQGGSMFME